MTAADRFALAHAVAAYLYNTNALRYVSDVYGDGLHPAYIAEKAELYAKSQVRALSMLDGEHFGRFVEVAWSRYGEDARMRAALEGVIS